MWPFNRKKNLKSEENGGPPCSYCGSRDTRINVNFGNDQPDFIKTWRGQRYVTYHCRKCNQDFSLAEPPGGIDIQTQIGNQLIDDEEALREAEEALKRDLNEDGDHRVG
jgi:hypothetical protein